LSVGERAAIPKESAWAGIVPLLLLILIDAIGFALLTPLLASALAPKSTSAIQEGLAPRTRHLVYGFATGISPLMRFFGAPILGQLSDRVDRKSVLLVCAGGLFASYLMIAAAFAVGSVPLLMAGRFIGGLTAASQEVSLAAIVDVCRPERKKFWLSMGLLASSLGFVIGPALGGLLSDPTIVPWFNLLTPLQAIALLTGTTVVLLAWLFHEPRRHSAPPAIRPPLSLLSGFRSFTSAFSKRGTLRDVSWVFLLQELAWGAYLYFIPVLLLHHFSVSGREASLFMSVMGIGFCLSFAVAIPILTQRFSNAAITRWSLFVTAALIAGSAFGPSMAVEWLLILPISAAVAVSYGALINLFTDTAAEDAKGEIMGITAAISSLSFGSISVAGGALAGLDVRAPIVASFALMTASWLLFSLQKVGSITPQPEQTL